MKGIGGLHGQDCRALRHSRSGGKARQGAPHPHKSHPTTLSLPNVAYHVDITHAKPVQHPNQPNTRTNAALEPAQHPRHWFTDSYTSILHGKEGRTITQHTEDQTLRRHTIPSCRRQDRKCCRNGIFLVDLPWFGTCKQYICRQGLMQGVMNDL